MIAVPEPQTVYTMPDRPDYSSAREVLAFLLVPSRAFGDGAPILNLAKQRAVDAWIESRRGRP